MRESVNVCARVVVCACADCVRMCVRCVGM